MGMSFWGLLAAPLMAASGPADPVDAMADAASNAPVEFASEADAFSEFAAMDEGAMADASGGADTAVNIGVLVSNAATQTGGVRGVTTNGDTGQIANNSATNNSGITTVFNNTGNGVLFQSTVNVNIFLGETAPTP